MLYGEGNIFTVGASLKSTLIAVALAGALALGACGSDPKPNTATESPATANSPTVAPVMPDLARENTDAGAEAFVRHYIDTLNYARSSGALEPIEALSDPECINCNVTFDTMRGVFGRGGKYEGGAWHVRSVKTERETWFTLVTVDTLLKAEIVYPSSESTPRTEPLENLEIEFQVSFTDEKWITHAFSTNLEAA